MEAFNLFCVFLIIVLMTWLKRPLALCIVAGGLAAVILFQLELGQTLHIVVASMSSWGTLSVLLVFYLVTFLQRMMEERGDLILAQQSLHGIFNNRRINASLAPFFIGLLPSASAITICGAIVDSACGPYLTSKEKTLVTTYFRHIPESFLPMFVPIILGVTLSGVGLGAFLVGMMPVVVFQVLFGYFYCLRNVPTETGQPPSSNRWKDVAHLGKSLWTIALIIVLIMGFDIPVVAATGIVIVLNVFIRRFQWPEVKPMFLTAFETRLLVPTAAILIFKDIIAATGAIETLPAIFSQLPIPTIFVLFLIFFFGTIVSGQQTVTVIGVPIAFSAIPGSGMPLLVLVMSVGYMAMQVSPHMFVWQS